MVRASINPEAITGKRPTKETALKMVSSGSVLNAPAFTGYAANKIVGFNRATAQPKPNNLQSLISNLSSSVYNNVTNIQNVLGEKKEPKERKGLFGFFGNLKETISLIQFLGSKKNLDKLKENLENLKDTFFESFEAVKAIRKVIKKIYDQLSGMESLSSGGGGGGNLLGALSGLLGLKTGAKLLGKKAPAIGKATATVGEKEIGMLPKALKFLGSPGKMLLGAGALAAGGALAETSGLAAPGGEEAQAPDQSQTEISGSVLDKFNSVLERFDKALDSLLKGKPGTGAGASKSSSAAGTSGGGGGGGALPTSDNAPPPTGQITGNQAQKEKQMFSYLTSSVGLKDYQAAGILGNAMRESGYRTNAPEGGFQGMFQWDASRWDRLSRWANASGLDPMDSGTQLQYALVEAKERGTLDRIKAAKTPEEAAKLWYNEVEQAAYAGKAYAGSPHEKLNVQYTADVLRRQKGITGPFVPQAPPAPVLPSTVQPTQQPRSALAAPGKQGQPQVSFVNLGGEQTQAQARPSGSGIVAPPAPAQNGPTAPAGSSFNPDNFLVLYSRMVYNIVDG